MGDRALIYVKGSSVVCYTHWNGTEAVEVMKTAYKKGRLREGDPDYCSARIVASLCEQAGMDENTGVGVFSADTEEQLNPQKIESHGDAGVLIYDSETTQLTAHGGYHTDTLGKDGILLKSQ